MFCAKCGNQLDNDSSYCSSCGNKVVKEYGINYPSNHTKILLQNILKKVEENVLRFWAMPNTHKAIVAVPLLLFVLALYYIFGQGTGNQFAGDWMTDDNGFMKIVRVGDKFLVHIDNRGPFAEISEIYSGKIEKGVLVTDIRFTAITTLEAWETTLSEKFLRFTAEGCCVIMLSDDETILHGLGAEWFKMP